MKRLFSLLLSIILLFVILITTFTAASESATAQLQEMYAQGELLMTQGDYAGAATQFETLGAYSDASQMAMYCKGIMAAENLGMYDVAISAFQGLGDFKDSKQMVTYYQGRNYQAAADVWIESEKRDELVKARQAYDEAAKVYSGLALFKDCMTRISPCKSGAGNAQEKINAYDYKAADALEMAGKLEEALQAFEALGGYSDSAERAAGIPEKIYARDYATADKLERGRQFEAALKAFKALGRYSDSAERAKGVQEKIYAQDYDEAEALEKAGKYKQAMEAFKALGSYSDSAERASDLKNLANLETVGAYVTFGAYPQNENGVNSTPIEWLVLDVQGNKSLLISRYALDVHAYHTDHVDVTWEKCELRSWLNGVFINKAFSATEQSAIMTTTVDNSKEQGNSDWNTSGGNNTEDKLFLLSYSETERYFLNNDYRKCAPTDYAIAREAFANPDYTIDGRATGYWWLRSPGEKQKYVMFVNFAGKRNSMTGKSEVVCVRPAFWINFKSDIFTGP